MKVFGLGPRFEARVPDGMRVYAVGDIHGRLDLGSPLETAWRLNRAWPGSELQIVSGAGHDGRDPGMSEAIVAALDRFGREP